MTTGEGRRGSICMCVWLVYPHTPPLAIKKKRAKQKKKREKVKKESDSTFEFVYQKLIFIPFYKKNLGWAKRPKTKKKGQN